MKLGRIPKSFTKTIAEREFVLAAQHERTSVRLKIGAPIRDVPTAAGKDWRCPVQVATGRKRRNFSGIGVDSLQALIHALKIVEAEVTTLEGRGSNAPKLFWFDEPWHGIPTITLNLPRPANRPTKTSDGHGAPKRSRGKPI